MVYLIFNTIYIHIKDSNVYKIEINYNKIKCLTKTRQNQHRIFIETDGCL